MRASRCSDAPSAAPIGACRPLAAGVVTRGTAPPHNRILASGQRRDRHAGSLESVRMQFPYGGTAGPAPVQSGYPQDDPLAIPPEIGAHHEPSSCSENRTGRRCVHAGMLARDVAAGCDRHLHAQVGERIATAVSVARGRPNEGARAGRHDHPDPFGNVLRGGPQALQHGKHGHRRGDVITMESLLIGIWSGTINGNTLTLEQQGLTLVYVK